MWTLQRTQAKSGKTIDIVKSCLYKTSVLDALNVTDQVQLRPPFTTEQQMTLTLPTATAQLLERDQVPLAAGLVDQIHRA